MGQLWWIARNQETKLFRQRNLTLRSDPEKTKLQPAIETKLCKLLNNHSRRSWGGTLLVRLTKGSFSLAVELEGFRSPPVIKILEGTATFKFWTANGNEHTHQLGQKDGAIEIDHGIVRRTTLAYTESASGWETNDYHVTFMVHYSKVATDPTPNVNGTDIANLERIKLFLAARQSDTDIKATWIEQREFRTVTLSCRKDAKDTDRRRWNQLLGVGKDDAVFRGKDNREEFL